MKPLALACLVFSLISNISFAQTVTVIGNGSDKETAMRDAMRNAVEQVVGTYIDSTTLVVDYQLSLDEIYTKAHGFVTDIKILEEKQSLNLYRVKAVVDVNTNPDSQLVNKINMIRNLNDPRIAVIIKEDSNKYSSVNRRCQRLENVINENLLNSGFKHILDHETIQKLDILNHVKRIASSYTISNSVSDVSGVDYVILGTLTTKGESIYLPNGDEAIESMLSNSKVELDVKIVNVHTCEVIGTFNVCGGAVANNADAAIDNAISKIAVEAADKVTKQFKKKAAKVDYGVNMVVKCESEKLMAMFISEIKGIAGINDVVIREQNGNKVILDIDTVHKPYHIIQTLRQRNKYGIFTDKMSNETADISVFAN